MEQCIFCRIIRGEIPSRTVYENDHFKAMLDVGPASKGHVLILPKEHYENLHELPDELAAEVLPLAKRVARGLVSALQPEAIKLVQNNGEKAGQSVMHFHMHVIPCYTGREVGNWKPLNPTPDELDSVCEAIRKEITE